MALECPYNRQKLHLVGKSTIKAPGSYRLVNSPAQEPRIPSPSIFNFTSSSSTNRTSNTDRLDNSPHPSQQPSPSVKVPGIPDLAEHPFPSVAECATHLELLEVFHVLRQNILVSVPIDDAMGIRPEREMKTGKQGDVKYLKDQTLWQRRQAKWTKYIEFAALRFMAWTRWLDESVEDTYANSRNSALGFEENEETGAWRVWLQELPPLDVLMVWHSFMLNPRMLSEECSNSIIHKLRMPWKLVHESINNRDWVFTQSSTASRLFERKVGLPADLLDTFTDWATFVSSTNLVSGYSLVDHGGEFQNLLPLKDLGNVKGRLAKYNLLFNCPKEGLATSLRDAVIRQAEFVDKMNNHLWIRSPALEGTIERAILRYREFLCLLKYNKGKTVVPTLEIDLVWHTHQCLSLGYVKATKAIVGRFINHDDTIVQEALGDGFALTKKLYRLRFGRDYRACGCWDCEMLLDELRVLRAPGPGRVVDMTELARRAGDKVSYYRAVEVALRKKTPLPVPNSGPTPR